MERKLNRKNTFISAILILLAVFAVFIAAGSDVYADKTIVSPTTAGGADNRMGRPYSSGGLRVVVKKGNTTLSNVFLTIKNDGTASSGDWSKVRNWKTYWKSEFVNRNWPADANSKPKNFNYEPNADDAVYTKDANGTWWGRYCYWNGNNQKTHTETIDGSSVTRNDPSLLHYVVTSNDSSKIAPYFGTDKPLNFIKQSPYNGNQNNFTVPVWEDRYHENTYLCFPIVLKNIPAGYKYKNTKIYGDYNSTTNSAGSQNGTYKYSSISDNGISSQTSVGPVLNKTDPATGQTNANIKYKEVSNSGTTWNENMPTYLFSAFFGETYTEDANNDGIKDSHSPAQEEVKIDEGTKTFNSNAYRGFGRIINTGSTVKTKDGLGKATDEANVPRYMYIAANTFTLGLKTNNIATSTNNGSTVVNHYFKMSNLTMEINLQGNPYTVHFDKNGGAGTMADQSFNYETARNLTPNAFERSGYVFMGWNTKADGSGDSLPDEADGSTLTKTESSVTLYAQWAKTATLYDSDGNEVGTDENTDYVITNHQSVRGNIQMIKTDKRDGKPLSGAVFNLLGMSNEDDLINETATSDENGYFSFTNIPEGTYQMTEKQAPEGYNEIYSKTETADPLEEDPEGQGGDEEEPEIDPDNEFADDPDDNHTRMIWTVTVSQNAQGATTVSVKDDEGNELSTKDGRKNIENEKDPAADITLIKTNLDGDEFLEGAKYRLEASKSVTATDDDPDPENEESEQFVMEKTTDANGKLVFTDIPCGTYTLSETEGPEGYSASSKSWLVVVSAQENSLEATATITEIQSGVSESGDGSEAPDPDDPNNAGAPGGGDPDTSTIIRTDINKFRATDDKSPLQSFKIVKESSANASQKLTGVSFTLKGTSNNPVYGDISETKQTDENGKITFKEIPEGEYILTENAPPSGYMATDNDYKVTVTSENVSIKTADGKTLTQENQSYVITNQPNTEKLGNLKVKKTDSITKAPLSAASFTLTGTSDSGETISMQAETDGTDGDLLFKNIPKGTYTLTETDAPSGYTRTTSTKTVTINPSDITKTILEGKKIIVIGDTNGITSDKISESLAANAEVVYEANATYSSPESTMIPNDIQDNIKNLIEEYGAGKLVVILGSPNYAAASAYADQIANGTTSGPLQNVRTGLNIFHAGEDEIKNEFEDGFYTNNVTPILSNLNMSTLTTELQALRDGALTTLTRTTSETVSNTRSPKYQNLEVKKHISGTKANANDEFDFEINLSALDPETTYHYTKNGGSNNNITSDEDGKATLEIKLKGSDVLVFKDLPVGSRYSVLEEASKYTASYVIYEDTDDVPDDDPEKIDEYENESGFRELSAGGTISSGKDTDIYFTNTLEEDAHDLIITKNVTGSLGDLTKEFEFTVEFENLGAGKSCIVEGADHVLDTFEYTNTEPEPEEPDPGEEQDDTETDDAHSHNTISAGDDGKATATFKLRDDEQLKIINLPEGATYKITEASSDHKASCQLTSDNANAVFAATGIVNPNSYRALSTSVETVNANDGTVTAAFENERTKATDTGVSSNMRLLIILLIGAGITGGGLTYFFVREKKRKKKEKNGNNQPHFPDISS